MFTGRCENEIFNGDAEQAIIHSAVHFGGT